MKSKEDIQKELENQINGIKDYGEDSNIRGWVQALEWVLK